MAIMPVAIQGDLKPVRFPCTTICLTIALPVAIPENPIKQYASPAQQFADSGATLLSSNTGTRNSGNQYEKCTADLHVAQSRAEAFRTPTR